MTLFNASACIWTCMNQGVVWECPYSNNSTIFGLFGPRSNRCFWRLLSNLFLFHRAFLAAKIRCARHLRCLRKKLAPLCLKKTMRASNSIYIIYRHYIAKTGTFHPSIFQYPSSQQTPNKNPENWFPASLTGTSTWTGNPTEFHQPLTICVL